jgi:NAD(P)-dependent dehydrogenase (short-subunit alcohol dehydrogenase family)
MNICVLGGGGPPGRFGPDFCARARSEGHTVKIISHCLHADYQTDHAVVDSTDPESVSATLVDLIKPLGNLDILLFNSKLPSEYPGLDLHYAENHNVDTEKYIEALKVNIVVPHAVFLAALPFMNSQSRVIFLTTQVSFFPGREFGEYSELSGYFGAKSWQAHLMHSLAHYNNRRVIVTGPAVHFDYANPDQYALTFKKTYEYIFSVNESDRGKIRELFRPDFTISADL